MTVQQPPTPGPAYVVFSAEIDVNTIEQLLNTMANCANQNYAEVHLLMSTPGGSVMHGINAYNVLRGMPFKLVTHNVGNIDSIGNAIYLAGEDRYACEHSTFMFHGVAFSGDGTTFNAQLTKEKLDSLRADENRIGGIITDRTKLSSKQVKSFHKAGRTMTAEEAHAVGIVHDVKEVTIPPESAVATLVFNR